MTTKSTDTLGEFNTARGATPDGLYDGEFQIDYDREVIHALADEAYEALVNSARYDTEVN